MDLLKHLTNWSISSIFEGVLAKFRKLVHFRSRRRVHDQSEFGFELSELPTEIIEKILLCLNPKDRIRGRLVCRQWHSILNKTLTVHFKLTQFTLKTFRKSLFQPSKLTMNVLELLVKPFWISERNMQILGNVKELKLAGSPEPVDTKDKKKYLKEVIQVGEGLWDIFSACQNVHVLIIDLKNLHERVRFSKELAYKDQLTFENLHTFEIKVSIRDNSHLYTQLLSFKTPSIQKLAIEQIGTSENVNAFRVKCINSIMFTFIGKHCVTLKALRLSVLLAGLDHASCEKIEFPFEPDMLKLLERVKLREFGIDYVELEGQEANWTYLNRLLRGQTSLQTLSISTNSNKLIEKIHRVIDKNSDTLQTFYLRLQGKSRATFDVSRLQLLNLNELSICVDRNSNAKLRRTQIFPIYLKTLYWNAPIKYFPLPWTEESRFNRIYCLHDLKKLVIMAQSPFKREEDIINNLTRKLFTSSALKHMTIVQSNARRQDLNQGKMFQIIKGLKARQANYRKSHFPSGFHILPREEDLICDEYGFDSVTFEAV